jgi:ATP-dependent helicase HrpB
MARLPWTKSQMQRRDRVAFLRRAEGDEWPDLSDAALSVRAEDWLAPFIEGRTSLADIAADDLEAALAQLLPYELSRRLDAEAPPYFETPAGSRHALDYSTENGPTRGARINLGASRVDACARTRALTPNVFASVGRSRRRDLPSFGRAPERSEEGDERALPASSLPDDPAAAQPTRALGREAREPAAERSAEPYGALAVVARAASRGNRSIITSQPVLS